VSREWVVGADAWCHVVGSDDARDGLEAVMNWVVPRCKIITYSDRPVGPSPGPASHSPTEPGVTSRATEPCAPVHPRQRLSHEMTPTCDRAASHPDHVAHPWPSHAPTPCAYTRADGISRMTEQFCKMSEHCSKTTDKISRMVGIIIKWLVTVTKWLRSL
jgi:hypothetical protein